MYGQLPVDAILGYVRATHMVT